MPAARLIQARADLIRLDLIAYERPLYQVLSLDPPATPRVSTACTRSSADLRNCAPRSPPTLIGTDADDRLRDVLQNPRPS